MTIAVCDEVGGGRIDFMTVCGKDGRKDRKYFFFIFNIKAYKNELLKTILRTTIPHLQGRYQGEQNIMTTP